MPSLIMPIGRMDRRITIQELTVSVDPKYGKPTKTWTDFATVWANSYAGGGREFTEARQLNAEISVQFQIRYIEGPSATMRILYDGRYYDIDRISEVGRRERLNIFAKARQE